MRNLMYGQPGKWLLWATAILCYTDLDYTNLHSISQMQQWNKLRHDPCSVTEYCRLVTHGTGGWSAMRLVLFFSVWMPIQYLAELMGVLVAHRAARGHVQHVRNSSRPPVPELTKSDLVKAGSTLNLGLWLAQIFAQLPSSNFQAQSHGPPSPPIMSLDLLWNSWHCLQWLLWIYHDLSAQDSCHAFRLFTVWMRNENLSSPKSTFENIPHNSNFLTKMGGHLHT